MSDEKIIFSMAGVNKIYPPQKQVLKNIYLSFFYGAKIGVIGLNGSGKSSLLSCVSGAGNASHKAADIAMVHANIANGTANPSPTRVNRVAVVPLHGRLGWSVTLKAASVLSLCAMGCPIGGVATVEQRRIPDIPL